jgi:hypothetical protein
MRGIDRQEDESSRLKDRFRWLTFDVESLLPTNWREDVLYSAEHRSGLRTLSGKHSTSREGANPTPLTIHGVGGQTVSQQHEWVVEMYKTMFRQLAEEVWRVPVACADDDQYAAVLNVQFNDGTRYECHVDTNPIEGLLFVTDHPRGSGGELVVANGHEANDIHAVDQDCSVIRPEFGKLVFFDGRQHSHYVRPLLTSEVRVVIAMNFYTPDCPEQTRPRDLNSYLYGED